MDWFTEMGVYLRLLPDSPAMAFDMATSPGMDPDEVGLPMVYHMQNMPESVSVYPDFAGGM